jgi:hypothetical protein
MGLSRNGPEINVTPLIDILLVPLDDEGTEIQLAGTELPAALRTHLRQTVHVCIRAVRRRRPLGRRVATIDTVHGVGTDTHVALRVGCDSDCDQP